MHHEYYYYDRNRLLKDPKIPMEIYDDNAAVFKKIAREMADLIKERGAAGKTAVMICPVGPSGQYPYFVDIVNSEKIDLSKTWIINMDEYLDDGKKWIATDHKLSFRGFMDRVVYSKIDSSLNVPEDQRIFPHPERPDEVPALIEKLGGVDLCVGGIGINGHLAFNEADASMSCEEFKKLSTRIVAIAPETRAANAIGDFGGRLEDMPRYGVTIGFKEIFESRKIRLAVFRDWHRAVIRRCGYGEKTAAFPVSMIADHADALIRLTEHVAKVED